MPHSAIARLFGPRFPLLFAVGIAVVGRLALPTVPDPAGPDGAMAGDSGILASAEQVPPSATPRPQPRPTLNAPLPLILAPQSMEFLRAPMPTGAPPHAPPPGTPPRE